MNDLLLKFIRRIEEEPESYAYLYSDEFERHNLIVNILTYQLGISFKLIYADLTHNVLHFNNGANLYLFTVDDGERMKGLKFKGAFISEEVPQDQHKELQSRGLIQ